MTSAPPVLDGVEWVRPRPGRAGLRNDAVLAVVLFAASVASAWLYRASGWAEGVPFWATLVWAAAMTLPLAARRLQPELVAIVLTAAFVVGALTQSGDLLFSNIDLFIAIYSIGAWGRNRLIAQVVRGVIVVGMLGWLFWDVIVSSNMPDHLPDLSREVDGLVSPYVAYALINILTNLLFFGGAWFFGDNAYRSARSRAALEQRTVELAAERERTRAQAVAIERLRIARELHDVVAHHVSVIGVQAGAARRVLARDPEAATASLVAIEDSAREAIAELHGLLGTLRQGSDAFDGTDAPRSTDAPSDADAPANAGTGPAAGADPRPSDAPARGFADLAALADATTASGIPTTFTVVGEPREASTLVGLTSYRIAQEALTNVRKHAGAAATAELRVRWDDASVEVEVTDTGAGRAAATGRGGLGQAGMRERVAVVGGTLEFGPRHRGGYLVRATLPLRRLAEASVAAPGSAANGGDAS
ncbi:sensor histidine kinase [Agromyces sp. MMS24-K17]|uniref:sensor histidine kinase n=1 Tax=Agromyces sp. MMS24-K17 TaxID=3372850 RepID=UPI003754DD29